MSTSREIMYAWEMFSNGDVMADKRRREALEASLAYLYLNAEEEMKDFVQSTIMEFHTRARYYL